MEESKKVAVIVRERQGEALRMALGMTILDHEVSVYVMDNVLVVDSMVEQSLEALKMMSVNIYSNNPENPFDQLSSDDISSAVLNHDIIIPY